MRRIVVALVVAFVCGAGSATAEAIPNIYVECNGSTTCDGVWFRTPVFVDWSVSGATSTQGCIDIRIDKDTMGSLQDCLAAGSGTATATVKIQLDQTPPDVTDAIAERPPDHDGWYTHPVSFGAKGTDVTSGLLGCSSVTYGGPDNGNAQFVGTCRDVAGNVGSRVFSLRYDATPPDLTGAVATAGDRVVRLSWPATTNARVVRTPGIAGASSGVLYDGPGNALADIRVRNGRRYRYALTLTDQAGNSASIELAGQPGRRLLSPARRAVVAAPPLLDWTSVRGANYYNVQLFHKGRKILSEWPRRSQLQLHKKWRYHGKRRHLRAGKTYTWYVWPGEGRRASHRYGRLIGRRSFTFAPV